MLFLIAFLVFISILQILIVPGSETDKKFERFANKVFFGFLRLISTLLDPLCRLETRITNKIFGSN